MHYDIKQSGERIRQLRRQNGYTQEGLAGILSIDRSVLSRIEAGKYVSTVEFLAQVSSFFAVSIDYLVFGKSQYPDTEHLKASLTKLIRQLEFFKDSI